MKFRILEKNKMFYPQRRMCLMWVNLDCTGLRIGGNTCYSEGITSTFSKDDAVELIRAYIDRKTVTVHECA